MILADQNFDDYCEGIRIQHTGVFLDDADLRWIADDSWGTRGLEASCPLPGARARGTRGFPNPWERIGALFTQYGLPVRDDGVTRWATIGGDFVSGACVELVYAMPTPKQAAY